MTTRKKKFKQIFTASMHVVGQVFSFFFIQIVTIQHDVYLASQKTAKKKKKIQRIHTIGSNDNAFSCIHNDFALYFSRW